MTHLLALPDYAATMPRPKEGFPVRDVCVAIAIATLTACSVLPQTGPMRVVCDDGAPQAVCDSWRDDWQDRTHLPRSRIVHIEVECVACDPTAAEMVFRALLTDGTTLEMGEGSWVPDWADYPE
jgi:hypothetical protein